MTLHRRFNEVKLRLEAVLARPLLDRLSPAEKAETLFVLLVELRRRVGRELIRLLDKDSERQFKRLMERRAESDEISAFFSVRIPDYRERVEGIVDRFCEECGDTLERLSQEAV